MNTAPEDFPARPCRGELASGRGEIHGELALGVLESAQGQSQIPGEGMANSRLDKHNRECRRWAGRQPVKYRKSLLAFAYRANTETHSFDGTLQWVSKKSRERPGEGVSVSTLIRHLKVFRAHGLVTEQKRRNGDKNMSSVYTLHFDAVISDEKPELNLPRKEDSGVTEGTGSPRFGDSAEEPDLDKFITGKSGDDNGGRFNADDMRSILFS